MRQVSIKVGHVHVGQVRTSVPMDMSDDGGVFVQPDWTCIKRRKVGQMFMDVIKHGVHTYSDKSSNECIILSMGTFDFEHPKAWKLPQGHVWLPYGFVSMIRLSLRFVIALRITRRPGLEWPRLYFICHDLLHQVEKPWLIVDSSSKSTKAFKYFWDQCSQYFGREFDDASSCINKHYSYARVFGISTLRMENHFKTLEKQYLGSMKPSDEKCALTLLALKKFRNGFKLLDKDVIRRIAMFIKFE